MRAEHTPPALRVFAGPPDRYGEEEVERAELDLAFVPRKSEREGCVTFREDPRGCAVVTRAVSYERP